MSDFCAASLRHLCFAAALLLFAPALAAPALAAGAPAADLAAAVADTRAGAEKGDAQAASAWRRTTRRR
jgi:hypothetical protein